MAKMAKKVSFLPFLKIKLGIEKCRNSWGQNVKWLAELVKNYTPSCYKIILRHSLNIRYPL